MSNTIKVLCPVWTMGLFAFVMLSASALEWRNCSLNFDRLPGHIKPSHYELYIRADLFTFTFVGHVKVNLTINEPQIIKSPLTIFKRNRDQTRTRIILHAAKSVKLNQANLLLDDGTSPAIKSVCHDRKRGLIAIVLADNVDPGSSGQLSLNFYGRIVSEQSGFYRNVYTDSAGQKQVYAATHFEPTGARKAFPCFDEPNFKATFDLMIDYNDGLTVLSNTEQIDNELVSEEHKFRRTRFARTPIMATYLLAYAIGKFDHMEKTMMDGQLKVSVYAPPGRVSEAQFALDNACRAFIALNDYIGIEQPLKKIDIVAIPGIAQCGIEYWGIVIGATRYLLVNNETMPIEKSYTISVITHALAHFWFGNLVTINSLDDMWLKEGLAEWIAYKISKEVHPEIDYTVEYLLLNHIPALEADSSFYTHAIRKKQSIYTAEQYENMRDFITVSKSSSLMRMLDYYVGQDNFKRAIRSYLIDHMYNNTVASDLWGALETVCDKPVRELLLSWLDQYGYPLLKINFSSEKQMLKIKQDRHTGAMQYGLLKSTWIIPVSMFVTDGSNRTDIEFIMDGPTKYVQLPDWFSPNKEGHWLKLNTNFEGFYRVLYGNELGALLEKPIMHKTMAPIDRMNFISDIISSFDVGRIGAEELLKILNWYTSEEHGGVLAVLAQAVQSINRSEIKRNLSRNLLKMTGLPKKDDDYLTFVGKYTITKEYVGAHYGAGFKRQTFELFLNQPETREKVYKVIENNMRIS